ncbi:MAG: hypothetical protein GF344_08010 [Chitinivibrionales bacterium]|nr:hypothetical protein [Chitinivibrionales bacterium]MBD3356834.1 hypothetical protein [Chitinivibrionales bacterium]
MLENIADGLLGLFVFLGHWFSPGEDVGEIKILDARQETNGYVIEWAIRVDWGRRIEDLIDAGIPLRFLCLSYSDVGDSVAVLRTLRCDVTTYRYTIIDTLLAPSDSVWRSESTEHIYEALRAYGRWSSTFSEEAERFHVEAVLLPTRVEQLGRVVDMSEIVGSRRFVRDLARMESEP